MSVRVLAAELRLADRAALARELGLDASASDAALVARGHERWGRGLAARLEGGFAYALEDERGELHAARDAFGLVPLFFAREASGVAFAKTAAALAASRPLDARTVLDYVEGGLYREVGPTFFEGVERIRPGHVLRVAGRSLTHERWFEPPRETLHLAARECAAEARRLLERAVATRLDASATTIVHASGGLDSSSIACLAGRLGAKAILFSAAYPGLACDERHYQEAVARAARLPHERCDATAPTPSEPPSGDHPFRPSSPDPGAGWRALARREGARVVLSGFGGDELFFERGIFRDLAARLRLVALAREAALSPRYSSRSTRAILRDAITVLVPGFVKRARARRRTRPEPAPWLGPRLRELDATPPPDEALGFTSHTQRWTWRWLTGAPLVWHLELEGALAAREGIEVRYPMLDAALARFVLALPFERRRPRGLMKRLLRDALAGVLPDEVRLRRGVTTFDSVVALEGRNELGAARALLADGAWASEGWIERPAFERLVLRLGERGGETADWRLLADLVHFEEWVRRRSG